MATITAKFPGQCRTCGGRFQAGAQIEWSKAAGSRHVKCPEGVTAKPGPSAEDLAAATITIVQDWRRSGKPSLDGEVGRTLRVLRTDSREHAGKAVTVVAQRRRYESDDDNADMGDCMGGGWWLTLQCRPATDEETAKLEAQEAKERAAEEARQQQIAAEQAEKQAVIDAAKAKLAEATAGLDRSESFDESTLVRTDAVDILCSWSDGDRHHVSVHRRTATTGETVFVVYSHDFDDDRATLCAPRAVIEASWAALAERLKETPEKAGAFLEKYSGCVGTDWRRWIVARAASDATEAHVAA